MDNFSQHSEINKQIYEEIISTLSPQKGENTPNKRLIAVSKQQPEAKIRSILELGQRVFGENRYQEGVQRWSEIRPHYPDLTLAFIGGLQSNKAAEAVSFFDEIHSVDRQKLADSLAKAMANEGKSLPCYIQVNTGEEPQKSGILPHEATDFISYCRNELLLNIVGLMCIPPADQNPAPHFAFLRKMAEHHQLPRLSMGMSDDWQTALRLGSTDIRVGSALFGAR